MDRSPDAVLNDVLAVIERLCGRRLPDGADKLIGADHGLTGWDSILLLEDLEKAYSIDLRPFADSRATIRKGWFSKLKIAGDATPRELAAHIAALGR
ncbi:MAG TPA: hypothetical protein VEW25_12285 [Allosphingosinicella sp.]|nr:hypothetical protein [Allosphingosinicella sp.]